MIGLSPKRLVVSAFSLTLAATAAGQCRPQWSRQFAGDTNQLNGPIEAFAVFDMDGDGPQAAALFATGCFLYASGAQLNGIARRDGIEWRPLGSGLDGPGAALVVKESDSSSLPRGLYAAGQFNRAGGQTAQNVARWDGVGWHALGDGVANPVLSLAILDEDGAGPIEPALFAGTNDGVSRWDGETWVDFPVSGNMHYVKTMTSFDEGSDGIARIHLFVAGKFNEMNGVPAINIARWDGDQWSAVAGGLGAPSAVVDHVSSLAVHDEDGPGPLPPYLVAGGYFHTPAWKVARWDGTSWTSMATSPFFEEFSLIRSLDRDADGPQTPELVAFLGEDSHQMLRWNETFWGPFIPHRDSYAILDLAVGPGLDGAPTLYMGGQLTESEPDYFRFLIEGQWIAAVRDFGPLLAPVQSLSLFDADGPTGPNPLALYVANGNLKQLSQSGWTPAPTVPVPWVRTVALVDLDGDGPQLAQLAIGGIDPASGVGRVALWNGVAARNMRLRQAGEVSQIAMFDADGSGPEPPILIALVQRTADSVLFSYSASDDFWVSFGWAGFIAGVVEFDRDGAGPLTPRLFAWGDFEQFEFNVGIRYAARYDGVSWASAGSADLAGPISSVVVSPNLESPSDPPALYAFGAIAGTPDPAATWLLRWEAPNWVAVGSEPVGPVNAALAFDSDSNGIDDTIVRITETSIEMYEDERFTPLAGESALVGRGLALAAAPPGTFGSATASLFAGGEFFRIGGVSSRYLAHWRTGPPEIQQAPLDRFATEGRSMRFSVQASGIEPLAFRWRRDTTPLSDDARITGATAAVLTISELNPNDAGDYDVVVIDDCGQAISEPAQLTITASDCPSDIDGSRDITLQDLAYLLARFGETGTALGNEDVNQDDAVDIQDLAIVLGAFGSSCP